MREAKGTYSHRTITLNGVDRLKRKIAGLSFCALFLMILPVLSVPLAGAQQVTSFQQGPYLNHVQYDVIESMDDQVLALQSGAIDLIGTPIDPAAYATLQQGENIEIQSTPRNGVDVFYFNCAKYPYNITAFRRAVAFALDKDKIADQLWEGFATPQDSPIPRGDYFSAEGLLNFSYYEPNVELGSHLLNAAGFADVNGDGIREAPNGNEFHMTIEVPSNLPLLNETGQILADACTALGINATSVPTDYYEILNSIYFNVDFDCILIPLSYGSDDAYQFALDYYPPNPSPPSERAPIWDNGTFETWRSQVLTSTDYQKVYEAAIMMQQVWVYQCPGIVCCQNQILSAFRTDRFGGFVNSNQAGIPCYWTNLNTHLLAGEDHLGGTLKISLPVDVDTFNFMTTTSDYTRQVLENTYDSLMKQAPDGSEIFWLAESYTVKTHLDDPELPAWHERFTFQIRQDASWTDGTPLTAEDVAYSLNYYREAQGNPYGLGLSSMVAAYAPTNYSVVVEFEHQSYWYLHAIAYLPVIPKHVFQNIGLNGWNTWNPNPSEESWVTSGSFVISSHSVNEAIDLTYNPTFFLGIPNHPNDTTPVGDSTTTGNTPPITVDGISRLALLSYFITISSIVVVAVVLIKWRSEKPVMFS